MPDPSFSTTAPIVARVVRRHATEAATRWWRRSSAYLDYPRTQLYTLAQYDQSIDAHLDGLLVAGHGAGAILDKALAIDAPDLAADLFTLLALAFLGDQDSAIDAALARAEALPCKAVAR